MEVESCGALMKIHLSVGFCNDVCVGSCADVAHWELVVCFIQGENVCNTAFVEP